ncbi:PPOX class F420-dependent oxidoreductase [Streptomyces sp. NPDC014733]|uniref:PPOX class F420-dependent oxidoreductase n=1 Tax=Streptomyces sp. NPDC014733 TaxID=3364885 RepID=UPI0036F5655B
MIELPNDIRRRIEAPTFWYVATVNPDGSPHVSPMWVGLAGDLLLFNTSVGRIKERNLRHDPRVCLSHADPDDPYDRVQIHGRAVRFVEGPEAERNMDELARVYRGAAGYEWLLPGEQRVMVLIEPDRARRVTGVEPLPPGAPGAAS